MPLQRFMTNMIKITAKDIETATRGRLRSSARNPYVTGFSTDSRAVSSGDWFIAVKGDVFDGHDFISQALEKGASGVIVKAPAPPLLARKRINVLEVEDTVEAMGRIAALIRTKVDIPVICVTGTNGKTTVKDLLAHVLAQKFKVLKSDRSYNNIIGLSLTLFDMEREHEAAVLEIGTNHPGEISRLAAIAQPHMAIITNIGDGHLEAFSDREGVFVEKISLLDALPQTGLAILNRDDAFLSRAAVHDVTVKYFGMSPKAGFRIEDVERLGNGYRFRIGGEEFTIPLEGEHNVHNAAAVICAAKQFGFSRDDIQQALSEGKLPGMRLEKVRMNGITFINDAYNANPDSFESALDLLQASRPEGKKGVIAGDMLELGEKSGEFHRMIGKSIAERKIDFIITLGERSREIALGAIERGINREAVMRAESHEHAAEIVRQVAGPGALVLLKGSRGMRMEEVLKCFTTFCTR